MVCRRPPIKLALLGRDGERNVARGPLVPPPPSFGSKWASLLARLEFFFILGRGEAQYEESRFACFFFSYWKFWHGASPYTAAFFFVFVFASGEGGFLS